MVFSPHGGGFFRDLSDFPPMVGAKLRSTHHGGKSWVPNRWWFFPPWWGENRDFYHHEKKVGAKFRSTAEKCGCKIFIFPPWWWSFSPHGEGKIFEIFVDFPPMVVVFPAILRFLVVPENSWKNPPPWGENFPSTVGGGNNQGYLGYIPKTQF